MITSTKAFSLIFSLTILAVLFYPQPTKAELATSYDWMGLFIVGTEDTDASDIPLTNNAVMQKALLWKTTGNNPGSPCLTSLPSTRPWLAGGCSLQLPSSMDPGAYEFRLYGNYRSDNLVFLLSHSKQFWIDWPNPALTATCAFNGDRINIDLSWPTLLGIYPLIYPLTDHYKIYDNDSFLDISYINTYRDVVNPNTNHSYYVIGYNSFGSSPRSNIVPVAANSANCPGGLMATPTPTPSVAPTSTPTPTTAPTATPTPGANSPWLKTSGGDVHSNQ
ncbi:MAG: hypothetical protein Q7S44_02360 [bacterium]|nr:hypothetical protein [bacterium]